MSAFIALYVPLMGIGLFFHLGYLAGSKKSPTRMEFVTWTLFGWIVIMLSLFISLLDDLIKYLKKDNPASQTNPETERK